MFQIFGYTNRKNYIGGVLMATAEQLNTIKDNWTKLTLKEIGELTGYSQSSVRRLGNRMGLVRGRSLSSWGSISQGSLQELADRFYIGQKLKLKMYVSERKEKIVHGKVLYKTRHFITVKINQYKESFKYIDFILGDIEIL